MAVSNPGTEPPEVVQSLVRTLCDVFDATLDTYQTLKNKSKRDLEESLRARGFSSTRRIDIHEEFASDEKAIAIDKESVTRQLETGVTAFGRQFAVGDAMTQASVQSQIIGLQSVIITTFLYGPTSDEPISKQLATLVKASRTAGKSTVEALDVQHQRQLDLLPLEPPQSVPPPPTEPTIRTAPSQAPSKSAAVSSASTALVRSTPAPAASVGHPTKATSVGDERSKARSSHGAQSTVVSPTKTTIVSEGRSRPKSIHSGTTSVAYPAKTTTLAEEKSRTANAEVESAYFSGSTSHEDQSLSGSHVCRYARDLQKHSSQPLHASLTSSDPHCPHCKRELHVSPGKTWEVVKDDNGKDRCFRIQNRFVVKCHRNSVDGGYSCLLCTNNAAVETVCGEVKALVRHIWMDHSPGELEKEEDVVELVEKEERRRDSGMDIGPPQESQRRSRRSASVGGPRKSRGRRSVSREVETLEIWAPRR